MPSLRTPIFRRFCAGRRRATRAPKAICALRCEVENGIHVLQRPYASNFAKVPGKSQLYIIVEQHEMKTREQSNIFFFWRGEQSNRIFFFFWEGVHEKKNWLDFS